MAPAFAGESGRRGADGGANSSFSEHRFRRLSRNRRSMGQGGGPAVRLDLDLDHSTGWPARRAVSAS